MQIKAYAKLNLKLDILDRRKDGLHNIDSEFIKINLFDFITIEKSNRFELIGSIITKNEKNLIIKARQALEKHTKRNFLCKIQLNKSIPISAGLGGGSSDCASVLVGLNKIYNLGIPKKDLMKIGFELGSDVPFFISKYKKAIVQGAGEKVIKNDFKTFLYYVIARPHRRISTKEIFAEYTKAGKSFVEIVSQKCPDVKRLLEYFQKYSKQCGMSGTGPCVYAGFNIYEKAYDAIKKFNIDDFNGDFYIVNIV